MSAPLTGAGGGGGGGGGYPPSQQSDVVTQQIASALIQLQQDMNSVLIRLNTLEALTVAQAQVSTHAHTSESTSVCSSILV